MSICLLRAVFTGIPAGVAGLLMTAAPLRAGEPFEFSAMKQVARERASRPYATRESPLAGFWKDLPYAEYRKIQFHRERALWADEKGPLALEFFHPGWVFPQPLEFRSVRNGNAETIPWDESLFDYGGLTVPPGTVPPTGYAGYRVLAGVNDPERLDELAVFLGGTYFRALAPGLGLGTSARALALNPQLPRAEEVPSFEQWWLEHPDPDSRELRAWALMDSPSAVGAWQFRIQPGRATVMEIDGELTFRQEVAMPGIAPFSSMHWYSEYSRERPSDYRPEVHDADGLLIHFQDSEAVWRPLDRSKVVRHSAFRVNGFVGFGLAQRDREFSSYQDLGSAFQTRPSVWVEPVGKWPAGSINLIETPATGDSLDNVVCFWKPDDPIPPGKPMAFSYRIHWLGEVSVPGLARVVASRRAPAAGTEGDGGSPPPPGEIFLIDFSPLANPADDAGEPQLLVEVDSTVSLAEKRLERNPHTGGWRAVFRLGIPANTRSTEIACRLVKDGRFISERWSALWKNE